MIGFCSDFGRPYGDDSLILAISAPGDTVPGMAATLPVLITQAGSVILFNISSTGDISEMATFYGDTRYSQFGSFIQVGFFFHPKWSWFKVNKEIYSIPPFLSVISVLFGVLFCSFLVAVVFVFWFACLIIIKFWFLCQFDDINGDGVDDFLIGAPMRSDDWTEIGPRQFVTCTALQN